LIDQVATFPAHATLKDVQFRKFGSGKLSSFFQRALYMGPVGAAARARCSSVTRITFEVRVVHVKGRGRLNLSTDAAETASTTKL